MWKMRNISLDRGRVNLFKAVNFILINVAIFRKWEKGIEVADKKSALKS